MLPRPKPIPEYANMERERFEAEIRPARQPAIFRNLASHWPAAQAGRNSAGTAVDYLKRFSHGNPVPVILGPPEIAGRFFYTDDLKSLNFQRGNSPLNPFLDRLLRDQANVAPFAMAMQSMPLPELLPGFAEENRLSLIDHDVIPRLWVGNAIRVATHYDLMENVGVVIAGRRRFTVFPPDQIANLYPGPFELTPAGTPVSLVDPGKPDLERFPRFADAMASAQTATLEIGDAIYLPFHWWHAVDSLEPFSAFVNYWWNRAAVGLVSPYESLIVALMSLRGLPADQKDVWRMLFDHYVFEANGDPVAHLPADVKGVLGPLTPRQIGRMKATLLASLGGS